MRVGSSLLSLDGLVFGCGALELSFKGLIGVDIIVATSLAINLDLSWDLLGVGVILIFEGLGIEGLFEGAIHSVLLGDSSE